MKPSLILCTLAFTRIVDGTLGSESDDDPPLRDIYSNMEEDIRRDAIYRATQSKFCKGPVPQPEDILKRKNLKTYDIAIRGALWPKSINELCSLHAKGRYIDTLKDQFLSDKELLVQHQDKLRRNEEVSLEEIEAVQNIQKRLRQGGLASRLTQQLATFSNYQLEAEENEGLIHRFRDLREAHRAILAKIGQYFELGGDSNVQNDFFRISDYALMDMYSAETKPVMEWNLQGYCVRGMSQIYYLASDPGNPFQLDQDELKQARHWCDTYCECRQTDNMRWLTLLKIIKHTGYDSLKGPLMDWRLKQLSRSDGKETGTERERKRLRPRRRKPGPLESITSGFEKLRARVDRRQGQIRQETERRQAIPIMMPYFHDSRLNRQRQDAVYLQYIEDPRAFHFNLNEAVRRQRGELPP